MDKKHRRTSILKTDSNEATPTKTFGGKNKRISFSGKNSVKEFAGGNEKLTVWGTSYEKEMEALQKAGDTVSQVDITGVTSMLCNDTTTAVASNKENIGPTTSSTEKPRFSFALLGYEGGNVADGDRTMLHALPQENYSNENMEELFQIKSFLGQQNAQPFKKPQEPSFRASTTMMNETGMEVSMMWQDIMSQTKEATISTENKISPAMGKTIHYTGDENAMEISGAAVRGRVRETISEPKAMEVSRSVIVPREEYLRTTSVAGEMSEVRNVNVVENDPSRRRRETVFYEEGNDGIDQSMVNIPRTPHHDPPVGRNISPEDCHLEESIILDNITPYGHSKSSGSHSNNRTQNSGADMEMSTVHMERQSQYNFHQSIIQGGDAFVIDKENLNYIQGGDNSNHHRVGRETIHYQSEQADMDVSTKPLQFHKNRGTIHFPSDAGNMEESMVVNPVKSNYSMANSVVDKENLCQQRSTGAVKKTTSRQTIHFQGEEGGMDETIVSPPPQQIRNSRQTIVFQNENAGLDESNQFVGEKIFERGHERVEVQQQSLRPPRQTIHFNQTQGGMEESLLWDPIIPTEQSKDNYKIPRQTIHFNQTQGAMDESHVQMQITNNKNRQTIHFNQNEGNMDESLHPRNTRQTIYYAPEEANLDQSVATNQIQSQQPIQGANKNRQTIHFNPNEGNMDESLLQIPVNKNRQTIHFNENAAMDESIQQPINPPAMSIKTKPSKSRETIVFNHRGGDMDQSVVQIPVITNNKNRQTIHFNPHEGDMDESRVQMPMINNKNRQTIHFNQNENQMDESLHPRNTRQTIYYAPEEGNLDQSVAVNQYQSKEATQPIQGVNKNRQTIHFNPNEGNMDESLLQIPVNNKTRQSAYLDQPPIAIPATKSYTNKHRQTIHFNPNEGQMDESIAPQPLTGHVYYDENQMDMEEAPQKTPGKRGTIYFNPSEGAMDQSRMETTAQVTRPSEFVPPPHKVAKSRHTVYYQDENAGLDETRMLTEPVELPPRPVTRAQAKLRQTVYDRGEMEISMTMGDGFMGVDIKTNNFSEPTTVQQQMHQKQRQTVYYQDENAALDVSGVVPMDRNASNAMRRGTIHFNKNDNDGMEESMVMGGQTPKSNFKSEEARSNNMQPEKSHPRQTIYFNNDQCGMDETLSGRATPTEQRTMGPLEWSMRQRANKSVMMNLTVQEALEMTINEKSRRNETIKGNKSSHMAMEQTMRLEEDIMEESVQMQKSQLRDCPGNVTRAQLDQDERHQSRVGKPRQTIYQVAEMEESMVVAGTSNHNNLTRRGTFNIPPPVSEEVKGGNTTAHLQRSTIMKNKTIASDVTTIPVCDSNLSDLNNSEDSIELIDSQDNARPVNNNKTRSNVSQRLSSPLLQDETVNDLILNFNMTGQFPGVMREEEEDDDDRHEEESEQIQMHKSRIPIAKVTRTPIKLNKSVIRSEAGRLDMSIVDTVCRDAAPVMPRSTFGRGGELEDMQKEMTFVDGKKLQEMRMSIPAFAMGGEDLEDEVERVDNTKRQTMLEMKDLPEFEPEEVEMEEEEEYQVKQGQRRRGPCSGQDSRLVRYRQLDSLLDKFNEIDFEEGKREITELRYLVDRVANATPVEQSLYLSKTLVEDKSLRETVLKEIKEKTEEGIRNMSDDRDWGCFPLCLPMEDMIKNLVESEHKQWRYQDLFYYVGLLKFRHRLIKTFQVVIKFELGDPEFAKEHYLPFERFQIIEEKDLSKWSTVDQRMHKELMRQMPVGLVSLYGSSNELGRFLSDVDRICKRIFLDIAK